MKKQLLVPALTVVAVIGLFGILIWVANDAKPGDPLYTLDRATEAAKLSLYKSVNKLAYGRLNLRLADERFVEIKSLQQQPVTSMGVIPKVLAQTPLQQQLQEQIALLLADISKNLTEAQDTLLTLPAAQQEELSLEIAEKTTEYGNELVEIIAEIETANEEKLQEMVQKLEKLDQAAMNLLVKSQEDENENELEDENDDDVSETLQSKLETKLLKLREELRIYVARMETNRTKLSAESLQKAAALIPEITNQLAAAEVQLGQQQYKATADILDIADDNIDTLKDLVKIDGDEDAGQDSDNKDETEDKEDESENEKEDEDEVKPTQSVSSTPKPTEKPEDTEDEDKSEDEDEAEDEEDVEGVSSQPSSDFDLVRNQLRF